MLSRGVLRENVIFSSEIVYFPKAVNLNGTVNVFTVTRTGDGRGVGTSEGRRMVSVVVVGGEGKRRTKKKNINISEKNHLGPKVNNL